MAPQRYFSPPSRASQVFATKCAAPQSVHVGSTGFYVFSPALLSSFPDLEELDFAVCSTCYSSRIAPFTTVASHFVALDLPNSTAPGTEANQCRETYCRMNLPRVQQLLHKCALQVSIQPLVEYAQFAKTLPACEGQNVSQATKPRWTSRRFDKLTICNSCFEFYVRFTSFENHMYLQEPSPSTNERWGCNIGLDGFVSRILLRELDSGSPNFNRFASEVRPRLLLPECPGPGVAIAEAANPPVAYVATDKKNGIYCEACFYDHMRGTMFEGLAVRRQLRGDEEIESACHLATSHSRAGLDAANDCPLRNQPEALAVSS